MERYWNWDFTKLQFDSFFLNNDMHNQLFQDHSWDKNKLIKTFRIYILNQIENDKLNSWQSNSLKRHCHLLDGQAIEKINKVLRRKDFDLYNQIRQSNDDSELIFGKNSIRKSNYFQISINKTTLRIICLINYEGKVITPLFFDLNHVICINKYLFKVKESCPWNLLSKKEEIVNKLLN